MDYGWLDQFLEAVYEDKNGGEVDTATEWNDDED